MIFQPISDKMITYFMERKSRSHWRDLAMQSYIAWQINVILGYSLIAILSISESKAAYKYLQED